MDLPNIANKKRYIFELKKGTERKPSWIYTFTCALILAEAVTGFFLLRDVNFMLY